MVPRPDGPVRGLLGRRPGLPAADSRPRGLQGAAREVHGPAAPEVGRDPALGPDADDDQRRRVSVPPGQRLLLPDRHRGRRRDRGPAARRRGRQEVRGLRAAARPAPRGLGRRPGRPRRGARRVRRGRGIRPEGLRREAERLRPDDLQSERLPRRRREALPLRRPRRRLGHEVPGLLQGAAGTRLRPVDDRRRARPDPRDAPRQGRGGDQVPAARGAAVGAGTRARDAGGGAGHVGVRGSGGARRLLLRQRRPPDGVSLDRGLRPELLHPPLREQLPPDEGWRAAPERLGGRSTASTRPTSRGPIPSTATSRPSSARSTTSSSTPRRRRWRS